MVKKVVSILVVLALVFAGGYLTAKQLVPESETVSTGPKYATKPVERGDIKQGVNISGQLNGNYGGSITAPKPDGITDSNGASVTLNYKVEEVFTETNQMVKEGDNLMRLSAENTGEVLEELYDGIDKKQKEIDEINDDIDNKLKNLGKTINKDISSIDEVTPSDGIVLTAPIRGRLTELKVEEGEKVEDSSIATIVDDSKVKIKFKVNDYEYKSLKVNQKVLLQFRKVINDKGGSVIAFEGFYPATITKLNANEVPNSDSLTYVHNGEIEADNPGLVQKGMVVSIYTENQGLPGSAFSYEGNVTSFVNEEKIYSTMYSDDDNNIIATDVPVSENEFVEKGQMLVRIAGNDVTRQIQTDIDDIKKKYSDRDDKNEEIADIQKKIDKLSELESKMMVTAPMDGMIAYINYNEGDTFQASDSSDEWSLQLMDMYNTDEMYVRTTVSDLDVLYIRQDAPVTVTVDALPGEEFEGKVVNMDQYTDRDGKTVYNVRIKVNGREGLMPGMNTNCFVNSGEAEDTLLVPIEAVFEEDNKQKVEILDDNGQPEAVEIEVGLMNDRYVEVLSGLEEGQQVVTGSTKDLMPSQSVPENDSLLPTNSKE